MLTCTVHANNFLIHILPWLCYYDKKKISSLNQPLLVHKHEQIEPFVTNIKLANS